MRCLLRALRILVDRPTGLRLCNLLLAVFAPVGRFPVAFTDDLRCTGIPDIPSRIVRTSKRLIEYCPC